MGQTLSEPVVEKVSAVMITCRAVGVMRVSLQAARTKFDLVLRFFYIS